MPQIVFLCCTGMQTPVSTISFLPRLLYPFKHQEKPSSQLSGGRLMGCGQKTQKKEENVTL